MVYHKAISIDFLDLFGHDIAVAFLGVTFKAQQRDVSTGIDQGVDCLYVVLLVGDAPYYSRFGFARLDDVVMPPPTNPDRVLGHELRESAWQGVQGEVVRWSGD